MPENANVTDGRVAFVGLGRMGRPMAARLVENGYEVTGYDASEQIRAAVAEEGMVRVAADATATAEGCSVVILMVPTSAVVEAILIEGGMLDALDPGTLVIDMSSSQPMVTRRLHELAAQKGHAYVDAPVSGGVRGAVAGELTVMIGGEDEDVARAWPVIETMGKKLLHVGPPGAGHALKALNNLLSATHMLATSEAIAAGRRFGLDPEVMLEAINGSSGKSFSTELKFPKFVLPGTYDSGFGLRLMAKDMGIAVELAEQMGSPAALGEQAVEHWNRAAADLAADADHTEIARWVENLPDDE
jgi:3-hydroxyisobutyrate dehydrogenase